MSTLFSVCPRFFMCANSQKGFVEHFSDAYRPREGWHTYVIKGGPGTGKSTAMKKIASRLREMGETVQLSPCTADPDSLDAVLLSEKKIMVVDGTAPHVIEPKYAGVCEHIVDFGESFDVGVLEKNREAIIEASSETSEYYKSVYRYLSAAGSLLEENIDMSAGALLGAKVQKYALALAGKYIPPTGKTGAEYVRFLSGVTCAGWVYYRETPELMGLRVIPVCDEYQAAAPAIMETLRGCALERGYEVISCKNPLLPESITEHVLLPGLRLAFVTANKSLPAPEGERKIYTGRFMDARVLQDKNNKERIRFNRKSASALIQKAAEQMDKAKARHDDLERLYMEGVDFNRVTEITERLYGQILRQL